MNSRQTLTIEAFRNGLNCSQSVLLAYSDLLNLDKNIALSIACGFGAGMGRMQETCGAVTGSFMVLSVFACKKYNDNAERKNKTYELIRDFNSKFTELHGTNRCRDIIKCDLNTEEGRKYAADNNIFGSICEKCITDSLEIIDQITNVK
jgi:C_GCAxxG_C_C family probable redox protein